MCEMCGGEILLPGEMVKACHMLPTIARIHPTLPLLVSGNALALSLIFCVNRTSGTQRLLRRAHGEAVITLP